MAHHAQQARSLLQQADAEVQGLSNDLARMEAELTAVDQALAEVLADVFLTVPGASRASKIRNLGRLINSLPKPAT